MEEEINDSLEKEFQNLTENDKEFLKKCTKLADNIRLKVLTVSDLINQLKVFLVNSTPASRELGIGILSQVIELLPRNYINNVELTLICTFYCLRLKDHHVIQAVLKGILSLLKYENIPENFVAKVLETLFQNVSCQQQQQADRSNIYKILRIVTEKYNEEAQRMGFDFIYGIVVTIDGERDPRNLLTLFNWLPNFLKSFTFGHLSEEMFEVMACYFPVDFKVPSQDSNSITRESLAEALCECLCATDQFSDYCLPLALEKLSSSLRTAKMDSLKLLMEGCKTFRLSIYLEHSTDIWSQIQREVLNDNDQELKQAALNTLETVMNKLSQSTEDVYNRTLSDITDTLKGNLLPTMKLFLPSCKMLYYVAKSSKSASNCMITQIVPILINTYNISTTSTHQVSILHYVINFTKAYIDLHNNNNITDIPELSVVPNLCLKAILHKEDDVCAAGFASVVVMAKSLPINTRKCFYENLCIMLITQRSEKVRQSSLECFREIAQIYTDETENYVLNNIKLKGADSVKLYLDALVVIADQERFTKIVLPIITDHCLKDIGTAEIGTSSLRRLLELHEENERVQNFLIEQLQIVQKLIEWVLGHLHSIDIKIDKHELLLVNVSSICKLVLGNQCSNVQRGIICTQLESVIKGFRDDFNFTVIILLDGLLARLHQDVKIDCDIVEDIIKIVVNSEDVLHEIAIQLLANVINKSKDDSILEANLQKIEDDCNTLLNKLNPHHNSLKAINIISWIAKALIMRNHAHSVKWRMKLLTMLENHKEAAKSFKIIMDDNYKSLSSKNFTNIRVLYRQKLFVEITNYLVQNYKEENRNFLLAIGYLLQTVPKQIFILQFEKIVRLVILCLEKCEDAEVLCAVLDTVCDLVGTKEPLTEEYLSEFLSRLLQLTGFEQSMHVRIKALQCIQHYTVGYPLYKLLPHKQDIIHKLTKCVDDKKRLVRKEAVEARLSWYMLDAPF